LYDICVQLAAGGNNFSLAKIPAGRFIVEAKQNGKKSSSAIVLK